MGAEYWIWRFLGLFHIRPGEAVRAALAFTYLFTIICTALIGKITSKALFLAAFGSSRVPFVMVAIPIAVGLFVTLYARLAKTRPAGSIAALTQVVSAAIAVAFWWSTRTGDSWSLWLLYIWVGALGVMLPVQLWTLANAVFTTREAKRLFGFVGAGGILGALAGSAIAGALPQFWNTEALLLVMAVLLVLGAALAPMLERRRLTTSSVSDQPRPANLWRTLQAISESPHLRTMAGLVFFTALTTTTIDWQYMAVADRLVDGSESLSTFFGLVLGSTALIGFVIQLLVTPRIMRWAGASLCLLLLPVLLLAGTFGLLFSAGLLSAALIKGSDGVIKHSIDRSCREMMYLPVPRSTKVPAKSAIDMIVDRVGDGTAALLLTVLVPWLGFGLGATLLLNMAFLAVWIVLVLRMRRHYVSELRSASGKVGLRVEEPSFVQGDPDTRRAVNAVLDEGSEAEKLGALELVGEDPSLATDERLTRLAREEPGPVAGAALAILLGGGPDGLPAGLAEAVESEGQQALVAAIDVLIAADPETARQRIEQLVSAPGDAVRLAAMAFALKRLGDDFQPFVSRLVETLGAPEAPAEVRRTVAATAGLLPPIPEVLALVARLVDDPDPVISAAAVESAGRLGRTELLDGVIRALARPRVRAAARASLRRFGASAVPRLAAILRDGNETLATRKRVPWVLERIGTSDAIEALVRSLAADNLELRDAVIGSLFRLRCRHPERRLVPRGGIDAELLRESRRIKRLLRSLSGLARSTAPGRSPTKEDVLTESVRQRIRETRVRVFRLLALGFDPADVGRAHTALASDAPDRRANAMEFLDAILPHRIKHRLVPLLEDSVAWTTGTTNRAPAAANLRWRRLSEEEAIALLLDEQDGWIQACALHALRGRGLPGMESLTLGLSTSAHAAVREEAVLLARAGTTGAAT